MERVKIIVAQDAEQFEEGKKLMLEYAETLGFSLCFQGFDKELANLDTIYAQPKGILLLLENELKHYNGCVGIKYIAEGTCELKRLYVQHTLKGQGFGKKLLHEAFKYAQKLGYKKMVLDTLPTMKTAISMYEKEGFRQITPYYNNPVEGALFFEKTFKKENNTLDYSHTEFQHILEKTTEIILKQYESLEAQKGFNAPSQEEVASWFDEKLPLSGMDIDPLFQEVQYKVIDSATGNLGMNMYAYVMSGGNQISTIAELIMSTVNQNNTKWHLAPAMTEIEKRVIAWTAEMIDFTPEAGGAMVSGGSEANLAGLTVARNIFFKKFDIKRNGLFGLKPFTLYCSTETHNCTDKSIALLGIGTNNIRKISTNADFTINIDALDAQIMADIEAGFMPFCIVGNAGTVNTGAIDDLMALSEIAKKYQIWFHIDGAYGGLASSLPSLKTQYKGIENADSIALDFHKWLYQPFEIGCVLVRNWSIMRETYFKQADYLDTQLEDKTARLEFNEHYFQLSRNAKAFKVWLSVKAYGFSRIQEMIQKDIDLTHYLADLITQSPDFELKSTSHLAVVCFRYKGNFTDEKDIIDINQRLIPALEADGRVFITGTKLNNAFVLRGCLINHRKQKASVEYLLDVIRDVAAKF